MWIVELRFTPEPERLEARPAHRVRLAALHQQGVVLMAGPFADEFGSLMIFNVDGRDQLDQLLADDPYMSAAGVHVVSIRQWSPLQLN